MVINMSSDCELVQNHVHKTVNSNQGQTNYQPGLFLFLIFGVFQIIGELNALIQPPFSVCGLKNVSQVEKLKMKPGKCKANS